jgi:hypothetical protein
MTKHPKKSLRLVPHKSDKPINLKHHKGEKSEMSPPITW